MGKAEREFIRTVKKSQSGNSRTYEERVQLYRDWLNFTAEKYGRKKAIELQIERCIEELAELQEVLAHISSRPRRETLYHLLEEVGDVINVSISLAATYPMIEVYLGAASDSKLDKLVQNMSDENAEKSNCVTAQDLDAEKLFKDAYTFWNVSVEEAAKKAFLQKMKDKMGTEWEGKELEHIIGNGG